MDSNTLRIELEGGIRLTQPIGCPANVWSLMMSCWRSDPNARPSFGQLKLSLYQDHHFPKVLDTSENDNLDDHVRKKYKVTLEDSSMRTKYTEICQQNIDYLSIYCNNSENGDMLESGMNTNSGIRVHQKLEDYGNEDSYKTLGSERGVSLSTQYTAIDISETMPFTEKNTNEKK